MCIAYKRMYEIQVHKGLKSMRAGIFIKSIISKHQYNIEAFHFGCLMKESAYFSHTWGTGRLRRFRRSKW